MMRRRQLLGTFALLSLNCKAGRSDQSPSRATPDYSEPLPELGDRHLMVGTRAAELRRRHDNAAWRALSSYADEHMNRVSDQGENAENFAVLYLLTGKAAYAKAALAEARRVMQRDVRDGSYLYIGDTLRPVAMVLDLCKAALPENVAMELADFLARSNHELWFDNQGSGWALDDPGNNYHMAFLEGTAFAGYALAKRRDVRAAPLLHILRQKIESGVLPYLEKGGAGGDWEEGSNYGQRAKQRLLSAFSAIATMGGPRYFDRTPFFGDALRFAVYQLQPDGASLYPAGDLSRDSAMRVCPYDRDYIQMATFWVRDKQAKALGRWYLKHVSPSYFDRASFNFTAALYKDLLFPTDGATGSPARLPKNYLAKGTGWLNLRSGWDQNATSLCVSASRSVEQSHAHLDTGSFTLFKGGWQAVDAATYSRSGLPWEAGAHNMVHVVGHERRTGEVGGLKRFHHQAGLGYVQIDASGLFRRREDRSERMLADEYTRELVFLEPDTLVVFDRVSVSDGVQYQQRTHFAERPKEIDGLYQAAQGRGGMSLAVVHGGARAIRSDSDLQEGECRSWRVDIEPNARPGRFLTVLRVAMGEPPPLAATAIASEAEALGVVLDTHVVVFSALPRGAPPNAWRYRVPDDKRRAHLIFGAQGSYDARVTRDNGASSIELTRGTRYNADAHGILRIEV